MIMSTRPDVSVPMRLVVVTHVSSTFERDPNAHCANCRAISTS
jgi:hypothetical protein